MITQSRKIRNEYQFARALTEPEAALLEKLILWRKGSSLIRDEAESVVGCVAHPDDIAEFKKQLRARRIRIGVRVWKRPAAVS